MQYLALQNSVEQFTPFYPIDQQLLMADQTPNDLQLQNLAGFRDNGYFSSPGYLA